MKTYQLAVITDSLGIRTETFVYKHMTELMPGKTVVVARRKAIHFDDMEVKFPYLVLGERKMNWQWLIRSGLYFVKIKKLKPVQQMVGEYLRSHNIKVILSEFLNGSIKWINVAQQLGIKFFAHAHGHDVSAALRDPSICRHYLQLEATDGIITMSEHSRRRLMELGLSGNKIHVIPYGIEVPDAPLHRPSRDTIRCLAVGRMVAKKAPTLMLESFRRALLKNPNLRLGYIGDGELFDEARHFVSTHSLSDKVVLHGSQPNTVVQKLMKNAQVFLQHSRTDPVTGDEEGLPVAILEAMANSLPVVSTRHAGIPEAVLEGVTGYLVDEGDIEAMAQHIVQLTNSAELRDKFGRAGWERAKQHFSWEQEKSALLNLLGLGMSIKTCNSSFVSG
jgi:colanic acid/amylovoran biosynthesis glycosyltransferase